VGEFDLYQGYFPSEAYARQKAIPAGLVRKRRGSMAEFFVATVGGIWFLIVIIAMLSRPENSDNN
jgi:hypothetical protein